MIYTVVCDPVIDINYRIDELHPGVLNTDVKTEMMLAGKGIAIAKVIKALGEAVSVVGIIPHDGILPFSRYLDQFEIQSDFFAVEGNVRVNAAIVEKSSAQITRIASAEYRFSSADQEAFHVFLNSRMHANDVWTLSGALPQGFDPDTFMKIIQSGKEHGVKAVLDSKGIAFSKGLRGRPYMIKPNLSELESYFGEQIWGVHHIALKGKRLLDMGIEYVFISLGADGMIAIHGDDCLLCSVPQVEGVYNTGCGDALVAGFLVAQNRNFSFIEACRLAAACGTSAAMQTTMGMVSADDVWRLMEEVHIESA